MRYTRLLLLFLFTFSMLQAQETQETKPPLKAGKIVLESAASVVTGGLFAVAGIYVGTALNDGDGWDDLAGALIGMIIAYPVGNAAGASLVGNYGNERGSFWAALGGSAIGTGLAIGISGMLDNSDILPYLLIGLPPAGAVLGHNFTRSYKTLPGNALFNLNNGQLFAGMPLLSAKRLPGYRHPVMQFRLVDFRF